MIYESDSIEKEAVLTVAKLMAAAARTAPKTRGVDNIVTRVIDGEEKDAVAAEMRKIAAEHEGSSTERTYLRDAGNVDASACVVCVGALDRSAGIVPCGVCGFADCAASKAAGAHCAFNYSDLGTAACSAAAVAAAHHVDNRIMNTVGMATKRLGLFGQPVLHGYGIPVSAKGKSVYFDRG